MHCEECGDILDVEQGKNGWQLCHCETCESVFYIDDQGFEYDVSKTPMENRV